MPKRLTLTDAEAAALCKGGVCLSRTYIDSRTNLRWRCKEGHEWVASLNRVRSAGTWCATCAGNRKLSIEDARKTAIGRGGECLSAEYANTDAPLRWRCKEGHEWVTTLSSVKDRKTWCMECYYVRRAKSVADAVAAKQLALAFSPNAVVRI